jgi:hypothetical protein
MALTSSLLALVSDIFNRKGYQHNEFYVHGSVHHKSMYLEDQRDAVLSSLHLLYFQVIYVFQVSRAPIIRSTKTVVTCTGTVQVMNLKT